MTNYAVQIPRGSSGVAVISVKLTTDHFSPATGQTVAITISKAGAAYGNLANGATNATEIGYGDYAIPYSASDTTTYGPLLFRGSATGCDEARALLLVVNENNGGLASLPAAAANKTGGLNSNVIASYVSGLQLQTGMSSQQFLGSTSDTAGATTPNLYYGAQLVICTSPVWQTRNIVATSAHSSGATAYSLDQMWSIIPDNTIPYFVLIGNAMIPGSASSLINNILQAPITEGFPAIGSPQAKYNLEQAISLLVSSQLALSYASGTFSYNSTSTPTTGATLARVTLDSTTAPTTRTRTS